jgi:hypothetical protein
LIVVSRIGLVEVPLWGGITLRSQDWLVYILPPSRSLGVLRFLSPLVPILVLVPIPSFLRVAGPEVQVTVVIVGHPTQFLYLVVCQVKTAVLAVIIHLGVMDDLDPDTDFLGLIVGQLA